MDAAVARVCCYLQLEAFLIHRPSHYYHWSCLGYKTPTQTSEDTAMVDKKKLKGIGNSQDKSSPQTALLRAQVAGSVKAVICSREEMPHSLQDLSSLTRDQT